MQNVILTAIGSIVAPRIELVIRSKTRPPDEMQPVSQQIQNVEKI